MDVQAAVHTVLSAACFYVIVAATIFALEEWLGPVSDFAGVYYANDMKTMKPRTMQECMFIMKLSCMRSPPRPIAIKGAGYSQGGHTIVSGGIQLDLSNLQVVEYDAITKYVSAQAGATWERVLECLVPYGRYVLEMPSYSSLSVGGAISANAHGGGLTVGAISDSIVALYVITPAEPDKIQKVLPGSELFNAVAGGYGLFGLIVSATFKTIPDTLVRLHEMETPVSDVMRVIRDVQKDSTVAYYNAVIYPQQENKVIHCIWRAPQQCKKNEPLTIQAEEVPSSSSSSSALSSFCSRAISKTFQLLLRNSSLLQKKRREIEKWWRGTTSSVERARPVKRTSMIASDVDDLVGQSMMQEYFVPLEQGNDFLVFLLKRIESHRDLLTILNISVRVVKKIEHSLLNYAIEDSISIVLYFTPVKVKTSAFHTWTLFNLEYILPLKGKLYLPYLRTFSLDMLATMYPMTKAKELREKYDPNQCLQSEWSRAVNL
jgi:FAD/FMN-containing dehydrogenase